MAEQRGTGPAPESAPVAAAQTVAAKAPPDAASPWDTKATEKAPEETSEHSRAATPTTPTPTVATADNPPKAVVLRAETLERLSRWLRANWIYAVSAVSLAFAGLFLLQYGIEAGLLPPAARVAGAL
ncbi:MAG TPA: DUF2339 domain-containing protein, partial [Aliiroseovarius sp.]|nr:DUF2339 domain-containing protein [Aliiroseovarius sp.]